MKYKTFSIIALLGFIVLIISILVVLYQPLKDIQDTWVKAQHQYLDTANTLVGLTKNLGYGGLIHNFKNYVIRRTPDYFQQSLSAEILVANDLESLFKQHATQSEETALLKKIEHVYLNYAGKLRWIESNQSKAKLLSVEELDFIVKVDDTEAFEALKQLQKKNQTNYMLVKNKTESLKKKQITQIAIWSIILTTVYWFVVYILIHNAKKFAKAYEHLEKINNLSPEAMILVDVHGRLLEANQSFRRMFKVPSSANLADFSIEDFVPENLRHKHKKNRENFHSTDRTVAMENRNNGFRALKYDGTEFPVEITISAMKHQSSKVTLAIIHDKTTENELRDLSELDYLTQIYNRQFAEAELDRAVYREKRYQVPLSVLLIDIDHFKQVNDSYGHEKGDQVILKVVDLLEHNIRKSDVLARWGGDEFVCILQDTCIEKAKKLATKLIELVEREYQAQDIPVTLSIGIAAAKHQSPGQLLKHADTALYVAKSEGRNCWRVYQLGN